MSHLGRCSQFLQVVGGVTSAASAAGPRSICSDPDAIAKLWLTNYSAEVTTPDRRALDYVGTLMRSGAPIYIASLPNDDCEKQLEVAIKLKALGLDPVPHIVARNMVDRASFVSAVERFARLAGVDRALILGGDRADSVGPYEASIQLIRSGVLEANGIQHIAIAAYPEGHPRIPPDVLEFSLMEKLEAAERAGLMVSLITQLCFDADSITKFVHALRHRGVTTDIRVGLAGPTKPLTLLKFAAICGVGPSMRALRERGTEAFALMGAVTPKPIILQLAYRMAIDPSLGITGLHFFTFASLRQTIEWADSQVGAGLTSDD